MYAVGDAYKAHTECIQAYKKSKREDSSFYFFFILSVLLPSTARDFRQSSSTVRTFGHSQTPSRLIARSFRLAGRMRVPRDGDLVRKPGFSIPGQGRPPDDGRI